MPPIESLRSRRLDEPDAPTSRATTSFGGDLTAYRTFGDTTILSAGTFGWFLDGTDRWPEGEFFRYEITAL